jgi:Polysaccharide lyase
LKRFARAADARRWPRGAAAVIGALSAVAGPAPTASADTKIEVEQMTLRSGTVTWDRRASAGRVVLLGRGGRATVTRSTGTAERLVVITRRERCGRRAPRLLVSVDGRRVLNTPVRASRMRRYASRVELRAARHRLELRVSRVGRGCRLRLDRVLLISPRSGERVTGPTRPVVTSPAPVHAEPPVAGAPARGGARCPGSLPAPTGPQPAATFVGDLETGDLSQWATPRREGVERVAEDRLSVVGSPVRQGRFASRHEVRFGDVVQNGTRSELVWGASIRPKELALQPGSDWHIGWSSYFPAGFPSGLHDDFAIFFQLHPYKGPPPIAMQAVGNELLLNVLTFTPAETVPYRAPLVRDCWHDFVLRVRSSTRPDGLVELWHNGRKVVSSAGPNLAHEAAHPSRWDDDKSYRAGTSGTYLKLGLYRSLHEQRTAVLYHDALRFGKSYEAVAPH